MMTAKELLHQFHLKATPIRLAVLSYMLEHPVPTQADHLYQALQQQGKQVHLCTVYRTLDLLVEQGIAVRNVQTQERSALFTLSLPSPEGHTHYLHCLSCGQFIALEQCPFTHMIHQVQEELHFQVACHSMDIEGYCQHCLQKTSSQAK